MKIGDCEMTKKAKMEEDKPIMHYEELWNRLFNWLNDMRLAIAPDETVTDIDKRKYRCAQIDLIDEVMDWMADQEEEVKNAK